LHAESAEPAAPSGENLISVLPHHQNAWSVRGESRIKEIKRKGQSKEKKKEKIATKKTERTQRKKIIESLHPAAIMKDEK